MTSQPAPHLPPPHEAPLPRGLSAHGVRHHPGVAYAAVPGARPPELDLYLPEDGPIPPVVLFLHGGGWRVGSRHGVGPLYEDWEPSPFQRLARAGIAVASADYRLSGEATWPAQLHDAKAAVRWLRARASDVGIDPDRIAAWGESAGGSLAALLGLTGPELDGDLGYRGPSSSVRAVVAWYPPTDLAGLAGDRGEDPDAADSLEAQLLGAPVTEVLDRAAEASALTHVHAAAPPFLLLHGRADGFVPVVQSERLRNALEAAGADVEFHGYPGAGHMWTGAPEAAADSFARTADFLRRLLDPAKTEDG